MSQAKRTISKGVESVSGRGGKNSLPRPSGRAGVVGRAFTLIELLAVIAIIGLLAGLVIGLAGIATEKQRRARATGDHGKLVTAIDVYKLDIGSYPPDNKKIDPLTPQYKADGSVETNFYVRVGMNSLFYELSGATFANNNGGEFTTLHAGQTVEAKDLEAAFGNKGVQNSARDKRNVPYKGITYRNDGYSQLDVNGNVHILVSPMRGPYDSQFQVKGSKLGANPWFYNLTGTNKHNPDSYDLWTEYKAGTMKNSSGATVPKITTIGNWKE